MDFDYVQYDGIKQTLIGNGVETPIYDTDTQEWLRQAQRDKRWEDLATFAGVCQLYPDMTIQQYDRGNVQHFPDNQHAMYHLLELIGVNSAATETVLAMIGDPQRIIDHAKANLKIEVINQRSMFRIM